MHTEIYAKLDDMSPQLYSHADGRVQSTLRRWSRRLTKVRVFLREENGPRGGFGTRCRLVLETERSGSIVVTGRGSDADSALSRALQRARERVRRREERRVAKVRARSGRRDLRKAA